MTARSGVRFIQAFGYGYRAVAGKRGAYAAMIGRVNAGWFREQFETRVLFATARSRSTTTTSRRMMIRPYERVENVSVSIKLWGAVN